MRQILLLLCLLVANTGYCGKLDSLIRLYNNATGADQRVELSFHIVSETLFQQPEVAAGYLRKAIADSAGVREQKFLGKCYNAYGIYHYQRSAYDSALFWQDKALDIFTRRKDTADIANTIKNRGLSYAAKGDYPGAVHAYIAAIGHFKNARDTARTIGTLNDLGNAYLYMKNVEQAIRYQREALGLLAHFERPALLGNVYNSLGYIYDELKQLDSAKYYYQKSLVLKEKFGNRQSVLNTRNNLCQCIDARKETRESIDCFERLLKLQEELEDEAGVIRSLINLGIAHQYLGGNERAVSLLSKARDKALAIKDQNLLMPIYKHLSTAYKEMGDYGNAYRALEEHLTTRDSVFYNERNKETLELAARYELGKKDLELAEKDKLLLKTENEKLATDIKLKNRNQWLLLLSLLIGGGLLSAVIIAQKTRARQEKVRAAAVLAERDRGLKAIIDAQEEERIRIARELHDGVGNQLLALKMKMNEVQPQGAKEAEALQNIERSLMELMDEVRTVSHQMMPKALQEFGFVPAIRDMLSKTLEPAGIAYSFETHHVDKRYDRRLETAVYRVTQELVSNVIRHSGATEVSVQLLETAGTLVLLLEDNGRGIKQSKPGDGIGMSSIKSRVTAVNGEVNILPGEPAGTVVTIRIPVAES